MRRAPIELTVSRILKDVGSGALRAAAVVVAAAAATVMSIRGPAR